VPALVNVLCTILRAGMSVRGRARANSDSSFKAAELASAAIVAGRVAACERGSLGG